jgi:histidinol-phosphate phosphatase family protein
MARYVFVDRDGVINEVIPNGYVTSTEMARLIPGAAKAIGLLNSSGFKVIVVSNQQCVGKGIITQSELDAITEHIRREVARDGGEIHAFHYCPHLAADNCDCRKPKPGLLVRAQREYAIDLPSTYLIGDAPSDIEAARRAGCRAILVKTGLYPDSGRACDPCVEVVDSFYDAAKIVIGGGK